MSQRAARYKFGLNTKVKIQVQGKDEITMKNFTVWTKAYLMSLILLTAMLQFTPAAEEKNTITVGDSKLQVVLTYGNDLAETTYKVDGNEITGLTGISWSAEIDGAELSSQQGHIKAKNDDRKKPAQRAVFEGENDKFSWQLIYEVLGSGRITKTLTVTAKKDMLLERVCLWNVQSCSPPVKAGTNLQDIAALYRQNDIGLFASLDFPYSKITTNDGLTKVTYPPFEQLKAGQSYTSHSLTFGATTLLGRQRSGFDEGEIDAMDSYVQERFKPRFDRPMFLSVCINNRYTMPDDKMIFYTMKDHPTLSFNLDILRRELSLMPELGMEYYQVWTGPFDSVPNDPNPEAVKEIVKFAKSKGVRIGDYSGTTAIFCGHYNEYGKSLASYPEYGLTYKDVCFGNPKFVDFYIKEVTGNIKKYDFQIHCLDFLSINPCENKEHGHPVGQDSIYAQVKGLMRMLEAVNATSPYMMTWSNSGNWSEFLPKLAWFNHNLYLTDPYIATPWQGLNMTRLLDDSRREQMVSLHNTRFIPYRFLTNLQYFLTMNSIVPDIRNYQFGVLSTIAVTPNLALGEIRPWLDKLTAKDQKEVTSFYKKWTDILIDNYDLWKKTYQIDENPGMGSVERYGHAKGSHGFIFIVNPQYWGRTVQIPLDSRFGFSGDAECEIVELYPTERLRLTTQGPFAKLGTNIAVHVPAQQVIVLEVRPKPVEIEKPRMYGLPGTIEKTKEGYLIKTSGQQGQSERCAVLLPKGSSPISSVEVRADVPKQPKRGWAPTPVKLLEQNEQGVLMEVTFRRTAAPAELRNWEVKAANLADGIAADRVKGFSDGQTLLFPLFANVRGRDGTLPMWDWIANDLGFGALGNFCGAYVENAFSEVQETWIDLKTGGATELPKGMLVSSEIIPEMRSLPEQAKDPSKGWWLQTSFHLPFMYMLGAEPFFDEHSFLVLPLLRHSQIKDIRAWVNGQPLEVRAWRYPRNRGLACYYADLVGTGAHGGGYNTLVVYYETK